MTQSRIDNTSDKYLLFTWQPSKIVIKGDNCQFTGVDNVGTLSYKKVGKYFEYLITAGAKLVHSRQWELISVQALTGGDITLFIKDPVGADEQAIKPVGTITANTEVIFNKIFGAGEELIIKSAGTPGAVSFLVREYESGRRGN